MARRAATTEPPDGAFLSSVARALDIMEKLAKGEPQRLSDLARSLDVNKNIAFRLVFTLETLGYIFEDPATGKLQLTHKLSSIMRTQWLTSDVLSQAQLVLKDLAKQSGQLVRLATVSDGHLSWVFAETGSRRSLRIDPAYTGDIIPHVHATSKAYLMTLQTPQLRAAIKQMSFERYSPRTIINAKDFLANINMAKSNGFAMTYEEREIGIAAVAAPVLVRDAPGTKTCAAVVSLSVPTTLISVEDLEGMARTLVVPTAGKLARFWPASQ